MFVVRHHDDRGALPVEAAEKIHDFAAHFTIEVTGRLVGEQNPGCAHQSPCDGYALALSAGELRRIVFYPVGEADSFEYGRCQFASLFFRAFPVQQR